MTKELAEFKRYFDQISSRAEASSFGIRLFTNFEDRGNGTLQLRATEYWIMAPRASRRRSEKDMMKLWKKVQSTKRELAVVFVDSAGNEMSMIRDRG